MVTIKDGILKKVLIIFFLCFSWSIGWAGSKIIPTLPGKISNSAEQVRGTSHYAAFSTAAAAGMKHLVIDKSETLPSGTITVTSELTCKKGAILSFDSTRTTLHINGQFNAQLAQCFNDTAASPDYTKGVQGLKEVYVQWWGAKGDGVADDTLRIQSAENIVFRAGGGIVHVPSGHYIIKHPVRVHDNVQLVGEGYSSWIENIATSGFDKCTIITGNIGDISNHNGMYGEPRYGVNAIAAGGTTVTFVNRADSNNFVVGDIVAIMSYEKWPVPYPENTPKYINLNIVVAKSLGTVTLKHALPDAYPSSPGNPQIARMSGTVKGYDGQPLWMAKKASVRNLRLTQVTGGTSGWYDLYAHGVENVYENIWMDNASTMIGSNALSYSTVRNVSGRFEAGFLDFADFQNNNQYENISGTRFAKNTRLNILGASFHSGTDLYVKNLRADLGDGGYVAFYHVHRGVFDHPEVLNSSNFCVVTGFGNDIEVYGAEINGCDHEGIYIAGERHRIHDNKIVNEGRAGTFYCIFITSAVKEYNIYNNICGIDGRRSNKDNIVQRFGFSKSGKIKNNVTYDAENGAVK